MKSLLFTLSWGAVLVRSALNLDGTQAVDPAIVEEDDPSPISDPNTYHPDQYDCPLACVDYANTHSWTPYLSVACLHRCKEPMLLQFSVTQPLDENNSTILIRSCTLGPRPQGPKTATLPRVKNPKLGSNLFEGGSLDLAPACATEGTETDLRLQLGTSHGEGNTEDSSKAADLLEGMLDYFAADDNCDENFLFAYHQKTVASLYIGAGLGKPTVASALEALAGHLRSSTSIPDYTVAQLCGNGRRPERVFGISIGTTGDLAAVQSAAFEWSKGNCAVKGEITPAGHLAGVTVWDIAGGNQTLASNDTLVSNGTLSTNTTLSGSERSLTARWASRFRGDGHGTLFRKRAVCRYIQIVAGDSCAALASRCKISGADFTKYNSKSNFCATLQPGNYACCSSGDPFTPPKPVAPKQNSDGTCATHLIQNGDSCDKLAKQYGVSIADLEKWNKGKTWAWTACQDMLVGYNMCLSTGLAPMPPPQQGTECGPLVPGTKRPTDSSISLADLNPCPLKACCSNWGFCGVFPGHCKVNAPPGGGPGTKAKGFQNTCVSNCNNDIKQNSGLPKAFQRIGYYEAFGLERDCLWLKAKNANTDGSYTHVHWAFASIDPKTWKPVIKDTKGQWADFKKLPVKRIVSFGGWADSTEPATYNIIRSAIINNGNTFANNLAQFVKDEGIDGVDIDWEYPGAPDILVGGKPIGQKTDGAYYLSFLTILKARLGTSKSVSIAAPASYWYLKAFPIDRIATVIDYIVYMTYDLHGQWDYGNPNAFDMCASGKCIRSHVNLTETMNSLSMITKAGVPNNKIFVGEASYGRSFHMARDGCWGPLCEFTGSRTKSDAKPGRCTKTGGYLAYAEIIEILKRGDGARTFFDANSNSDIMLYKGDYVSFMTPATKDKRRNDWKKLNFAGSIDWAVDLQAFTSDDIDTLPSRPTSGTGCIQGRDDTINSDDLCAFTCEYGFCPPSLCTCTQTGPLRTLPAARKTTDIRAHDPLDVDLNRLCKFSCTYGYCPGETCISAAKKPDVDEPVETGYDYDDARSRNSRNCFIYKDTSKGQWSLDACKSICQPMLDEAKEEGRKVANYGCIANFPLDKEIPWQRPPSGDGLVVTGQCNCDNFLVNELAEFVLDAMPIIAQIGCYILMSAVKLVLDIGASFIPGAGRVLDAGLDMAATAAKTASYIYPASEDPAGAFSWWLSPCGGTDLVPDEIKRVFDILNLVPESATSFKKPTKIKKGSGKKDDEGNPRARPKPRPNTGGSGKGNGRGSSPTTTTKACNVPPRSSTSRVRENTMRLMSCDTRGVTKTKEMIITSLTYAKNAQPTHATKTCSGRWTQACYHYSSVNSNNPRWNTLTCPPEAAATAWRFPASATSVWVTNHTKSGWLDSTNRKEPKCDMDEWPPAYFLNAADPAWIEAGKNKKGQRMRYLPSRDNRGAASAWRAHCSHTPIQGLSDADLMALINKGTQNKLPISPSKPDLEQSHVGITVDKRGEFSFAWDHVRTSPKRDDALWDNPCWPSGIAAGDPGFALLYFDEWYDKNPKGKNGKGPKWDYSKAYTKGTNGD